MGKFSVALIPGFVLALALSSAAQQNITTSKDNKDTLHVTVSGNVGRSLSALMLGGVVRFPRERLLLWLRQREQGSVPRPRATKTVPEARNGHQDGHTTRSGEASELPDPSCAIASSV